MHATHPVAPVWPSPRSPRSPSTHTTTGCQAASHHARPTAHPTAQRTHAHPRRAPSTPNPNPNPNPRRVAKHDTHAVRARPAIDRWRPRCSLARPRCDHDARQASSVPGASTAVIFSASRWAPGCVRTGAGRGCVGADQGVCRVGIVILGFEFSARLVGI
jgi:hypothetical protein